MDSTATEFEVTVAPWYHQQGDFLPIRGELNGKLYASSRQPEHMQLVGPVYFHPLIKFKEAIGLFVDIIRYPIFHETVSPYLVAIEKWRDKKEWLTWPALCIKMRSYS